MKHKLYNRLLSLALAVGLVIGMLPSAAAVDTVGDGAGQPVTFADPDSPLKLNKTVTDNGNKTYTVNLEAYTTGTVTSTENAVPTDIVLVLDESGSMADNSYNFTPVYDLDTGEDYYVKTSNGYVRVSFCDGGLFGSHKGGWYTGIHFIMHWGTRYEPMTSAGDTGAGHVQFYQRTDNSQSRRDVLVEAAKQFANNIKDEADASNVDHRISIVHFADSSQIEIGLEADIRDNIDNVLLAIDRLGNNGGTYIEDGMANAETVFENAAPTTSQERNRVVVVFTDGIPGSGTWNSSTINNSANPAIKTSYTLKNTYGAKVYTLGMLENADPNLEISNEGNDGARTNKFLHYLSSNYPQAESMNNGGSGSNEGYYLSVQDSDSLNEVFEKIKDSIGAPDIELGTSAQVIDEVTQYFDLPSNASAITIQQADYNGSSFGAAYTAPSTVQAQIDGQKVIVTGFDFDENFVTSTAKEDGTYGKKLIISFTITPDPKFWGGNKVPTNVLATSGVTDSSGVLAGNFPDPGTQDVPLKDISLTGKNVNVYYGGATPDAAGLVSGINFPNDWRTHYVNPITYTTNGTVSNTADGNYQVTATLSPKYAGEHGANTDDATANVYVYKPVVTWTDSTQAYKTSLNDTLLNSHYVSTVWEKDGKTSNEMYGTAPTLTYTFTGKNGALPETLTEEAHVKVSAVKIGETDITDATSFKWQKDSDCPTSPTTCSDPNSNGYQFCIHVQKGGLTINKTVVGLDENGLNELKGKLTFEVKGNNGYEQTVPFNVNGWTYTPNGDGTYTCTYKLDVPTDDYTVSESGDYQNITNYLFDKGNSKTSATASVTKDGAIVDLKNTYTPADGYLTIKKEISGTPFGDGHDTFNFKVTAISGKDAGKVWYFTIKGAGETEAIKLPVGEYTIKELSNINYTCDVDLQTVTINNSNTEANPATVTFTNKPSKTKIPTDSGGVKNVAEIRDGQITWKQEPENDEKPTPEPTHD